MQYESKQYLISCHTSVDWSLNTILTVLQIWFHKTRGSAGIYGRWFTSYSLSFYFIQYACIHLLDLYTYLHTLRKCVHITVHTTHDKPTIYTRCLKKKKSSFNNLFCTDRNTIRNYGIQGCTTFGLWFFSLVTLTQHKKPL